MIPARYTRILVPLVMTCLLTFCVSLLLTVSSVGLPDGVFGLWMRNWGLAWLFAFPIALFALPLAQRIVARVTTRA